MKMRFLSPSFPVMGVLCHFATCFIASHDPVFAEWFSKTWNATERTP